MNVGEFEQAVWDKDGIRVVVRANTWEQVGDYNYANAAAATLSVTQYLNARIKPKTLEYQVDVLDGSGDSAHGRTKLATVRGSYR